MINDTLKSEWEAFAKMTLKNKSPEELKIAQNAFYAGALVLFNLFGELKHEKEEVRLPAISKLYEECAEYNKAIMEETFNKIMTMVDTAKKPENPLDPQSN